MITRNDVEAGTVPPKVIENGVVVPPALQINGLTLAEHRRRLAISLNRPLTWEEEAAIHPRDTVAEAQ